MTTNYKAGDKVYIIESNKIVRERTIVRGYGDLYVIRFDNDGGIQIKVQRLCGSEEEAEAETNLPKPKTGASRKNTASV